MGHRSGFYQNVAFCTKHPEVLCIAESDNVSESGTTCITTLRTLLSHYPATLLAYYVPYYPITLATG